MFQEIQRADAIVKATMGQVSADDDMVQAALDYTSKGAVFQAVEQMRSDEEAARRFAMGPGALGAAGLNEEVVAPAAPVRHFEFTPVRIPEPPPNPIHAKLDELIEYQKSEAQKKDMDRSGAKADSGESKQIAKSGLLYTQANFWVAVVAGIVSVMALVWGFWVYFSAKTDALESEKKTAVQIKQLRSQIRALTEAKQHEQKAPTNPDGSVDRSGQTSIKPK